MGQHTDRPCCVGTRPAIAQVREVSSYGRGPQRTRRLQLARVQDIPQAVAQQVQADDYQGQRRSRCTLLCLPATSSMLK
jgi:hypothetical protein